MADKYTYADVIIDPNDPRVEIGAKYYWADIAYDVLKSANKDGGTGILEKVLHNSDLPFVIKTACDCACLIRKKEPEKKYVPFDLSDPEVRKALMGKTIKANNRPFSRQYVEFTISCFELVDKGAEGVDSYWMVNGIKEDELFHDWTFLDGSICGKLTEGEEDEH